MQARIDIGRLSTVGEWFETARRKGYLVPTAAPQAITRAMRTFGWGFHEAYEVLLREEMLFLNGRVYVVRLDAVEALKDKYPTRAA